MQQLSENYLYEVFKCVLRSREVFDTLAPHLKYQFFPTKGYKNLWKYIKVFTETQGRMPSIGILSEQFKTNPEALEIIAKIKQTSIPNQRHLFDQFVTFIKQAQFLDLHASLAEKWNENKKLDAIALLSKRGQEISDFTLGSRMFTRVFGGFQDRHAKRYDLDDVSDPSHVRKFIPFYIPGLDSIVNPGIALKDTVLLTAQSGVGKTKALRYIATQVAKNGGKVAHFQAEGSKDECLDGYDATWMKVGYMTVVRSEVAEVLPPNLNKRLQEVLLSARGEIFVESFESFGRARISAVRSYLRDLIAEVGHIDLVIMDYFELFDPISDTKWRPSDERFRRELLSQQIKDIATEFNTRVITATQGSTVSPDLLNDPNFVMSRFNISDFKGLVRPFSFHITLNRTRDEVGTSMMRLYIDKFRNYKGEQIIHMFQNYDIEQFCDYRRTLVQGKVFHPGEKSAEYIYYNLEEDKQKLLKKQFDNFINT